MVYLTTCVSFYCSAKDVQCITCCTFQANEVKSYPQVIHQTAKNWWIILFSQMPYKCYNEVGKSGDFWGGQYSIWGILVLVSVYG